MEISVDLSEVLSGTIAVATERHYEYVTPELLLMTLCENNYFATSYRECGGRIPELICDIEEYLMDNIDILKKKEENPLISEGLSRVFAIAEHSAANSSNEYIEITHIVHGIYNVPESYAAYLMLRQGVDEVSLLQELMESEDSRAKSNVTLKDKGGYASCRIYGRGDKDSEGGADGFGEGAEGFGEGAEDFGEGAEDFGEGAEDINDGNEDSREGFDASDESFREAERGVGKLDSFAPCLNNMVDKMNPLIGRQEEIERTIQILCRKEKNNPIHIGEPGVGKTAITYGLVRMINEGNVPDALKGAKVYSLDLGSVIAGSQFRGEFEKRLKRILSAISKEKKPILFIDEIHNLLGTGATGDSSFDAANLLKPYMTAGHIRFIGATTYEEYKKHFEKSKSLVRRFINVEIKEPSESECVMILQGLCEKYEKYHGIKYAPGVLEYAVSMSAKYINERCLPDKAIDLIDEAGAYRKIHTNDGNAVDKELIDVILTSICRVPRQSVESEANDNLAGLEGRILEQVYGQNEAVKQVVNAVKYSKAGLQDETKPLANLLFVGPTGVGKTEIARTLAKELGVKLVRFDMSEYGEKHSVAKLIGAPAGYVGYDEGGLLTEEIRKNPSSVLLLDEIEKAHADIYSTLLQVMDYATLTDNQGRKADFRNVIIIMTSNAGASRLGKAGLGFGATDVTAQTLMDEVKNVFQPEFRNRLNKIVVFNSMDDSMALRIARKKLKDLATQLEAKNISFSITEDAVLLVKKKGISREYGAREIERVIQNEIKPLLVDEILFGRLKNGGSSRLEAEGEEFKVIFE